MEQQQIFLVRHGETEWSRTGRHTGRTDIPLTEEGRARAEAIAHALEGRELSVLTSPLGRARETCRFAGFADAAEVDDDLLEWDYGVYEGRTTLDIRRETPDWSVWLSPIVNGESLEQVAERARKVIARVTAAGNRDVALFAHGHILRILAACWIGLPPYTGRFLALDTATISMLGYERQTRVIRQWNLVPPAQRSSNASAP
jgi:broad specificity phosphatase PhoE